MKNRRYVDIGVGILAVCFLVYYYHSTIRKLWGNKLVWLIVLTAAIFVNVIKLVRLYVILYGKELDGRDVCFIYLKTSIVNSIFPYKLGELYRSYVLGEILNNNLLEGMIITILDRFMDTIGLLIVILLNITFAGKSMTVFPMVIALMIFVVLVLMAYYIFPSISTFWNRLLIKNHSSKRKLWALDVIYRSKQLYSYTQQTINGRGIILVILSTVAWLIEIGFAYLANEFLNDGAQSTDITEYLYSILTGSSLYASTRYTIISVMLLGLTMALMLLSRKENK